MLFFRRLPLLLVAFGWLGIAGPASAANTYQVKETRGSSFQQRPFRRRIREFRKSIASFVRHYLSTPFPLAPRRHGAAIQGGNPRQGGRDTFFSKWAVQRARAAGVQGIYVFLCRDPAELKIEVDDQTLRKGFTAEDRGLLAKDTLALLKQKKYDRPCWTRSTSSHRPCERTLTPGMQKQYRHKPCQDRFGHRRTGERCRTPG